MVSLRKLLISLTLTLGLLNSGKVLAAAYIVPQLPSDNLVQNPWFRCGAKPCMESWVAPNGYFGASDKDGNPTPDNVLGTAARISTGRGDDEAGATVDPNVDAYLYQIIQADSSETELKFDMYWVTHTVIAQVNVYGGNSASGPWTSLWQPFNQTYLKPIIPESGRGQDLWKYYSDLTDLETMNLSKGYPYYKLEVHAVLPDEFGGFKITGIYFAAGDSPATSPGTTPGTKPGTTPPTTPTDPTTTEQESSDSTPQNVSEFPVLPGLLILLLLLITLFAVWKNRKKLFRKGIK